MPNRRAVLDEEFRFLLSLLRPLYALLAEELRGRARLWLQRLCWAPAAGESARSDRNEYLSRLYHGMLSGRLDAVFMDEPPEGALRPAAEVFPPVDVKAWLQEVAEGGLQVGGPGRDDPSAAGGGDADERTYLATEVLPGGRGAYGYLAVSLAQGGPHWVQEDLSRLDAQPRATSTPLQGTNLEDLLDQRPPPEERSRLIDLYDSLIEDIDKAEREPQKSSSEIERLLASLQEEPVSSPVGEARGEVSERQRELLAGLRERLCARRERAARRSVLLDSLESGGVSPGPLDCNLNLTGPPEQPDRDDVRNIRPENVALLQAAYPRQLVQRFLDGIVRERVAVLGRVRARRYYHHHIQGAEEEAAKDLDSYRERTCAWVEALRSPQVAESLQAAAEECAGPAARCSELAGTAAGLARELGAAGRRFLQREGELQALQTGLRADIELLRGEAAAAKRRYHHTVGNTL